MDTGWQNASLQSALNSIQQEASRETRDEIVKNLIKFVGDKHRLEKHFAPEELELAQATIHLVASMIKTRLI